MQEGDGTRSWAAVLLKIAGTTPSKGVLGLDGPSPYSLCFPVPRVPIPWARYTQAWPCQS